MKQQNSKWMLLAFAVVTMLLVQPLRAEMLEKTMTAGGMTVRYRAVLPKHSSGNRQVRGFWSQQK
jgi:hypothetical protein